MEGTNFYNEESLYMSEGQNIVMDFSGTCLDKCYMEEYVFGVGKEACLTLNDSKGGGGVDAKIRSLSSIPVVFAIWGNLTVNGGEYSVRDKDSDTGSAACILTSYSSSASSTVVINGGTFFSNGKDDTLDLDSENRREFALYRRIWTQDNSQPHSLSNLQGGRKGLYTG